MLCNLGHSESPKLGETTKGRSSPHPAIPNENLFLAGSSSPNRTWAESSQELYAELQTACWSGADPLCMDVCLFKHS